MTAQKFNTYNLKYLKGAPLSILFALMLNPLPVTLSYLKATTGYSIDELLPVIDAFCETNVMRKNPDSTYEFARPLKLEDVHENTFSFSKN